MDERKCRCCKRMLPAANFRIRDKRISPALHSFCLECERVKYRERYDKLYRGTNKKIRTGPPKAFDVEKDPARSQLRSAVKAGRIARLPCVVCGNPKTQGHHTDYSKPLDVIWLCQKHHGEVHRKPVNTASGGIER